MEPVSTCAGIELVLVAEEGEPVFARTGRAVMRDVAIAIKSKTERGLEEIMDVHQNYKLGR